eukprot:TRINITY_DN21890_c0_g1_i1.p1 TRINITY_DN21890_c0_g1~~TRINITY_DN21890_c0_g1_i1.p1  ORF type:complete len:533 (+),score=91.20 TRINITY_DN21890_c0_g1_i1:39-1637(+)
MPSNGSAPAGGTGSSRGGGRSPSCSASPAGGGGRRNRSRSRSRRGRKSEKTSDKRDRRGDRRRRRRDEGDGKRDNGGSSTGHAATHHMQPQAPAGTETWDHSGALAGHPHPPPMWTPFGYHTPHGPWGCAPHPHAMYPITMHQLATRPQTRPADDGVSQQVSEKFLMRNDYCQTFLDTGLRPQNFLRDLDYPSRYSEYPKIERLIKLKDDILAKRATPGMSLNCDLKTLDLQSLGTKFDVLLIDPPWEEYQTRVCGMYVPDEDLESWTMDELRNLKISEVMEREAFCFLWCGATHLENGRELLKKWGFRRVEDICWVKTNRNAPVDSRGAVLQRNVMYGDSSALQRSKEQCIVGVRGTLKRSVDTHFLHANCDVDLIMEEEKEFGSTSKPVELYETIEHFCLGRRRLELFGLDRNMRDGWLTLGRRLTTTNWNKARYLSWFEGDGHWPEVQDHLGGKLVGTVPEIETLRPKSPVRSGRQGRRSRSPRRGGRRADRYQDITEEEERPLPEDLGESAPPPEEDDQTLPSEMKFK